MARAVVLVCALGLARAYSGHNTPPVFDLNREWLLPESEAVGE